MATRYKYKNGDMDRHRLCHIYDDILTTPSGSSRGHILNIYLRKTIVLI